MAPTLTAKRVAPCAIAREMASVSAWVGHSVRKENGGGERGAAGLRLVDKGAVAAGAERAPREDTGGADAMEDPAGGASSESELSAGLEKTLRLGGVWPEGDSSAELRDRDRLEPSWGVDVAGTWDEAGGGGAPSWKRPLQNWQMSRLHSRHPIIEVGSSSQTSRPREKCCLQKSQINSDVNIAGGSRYSAMCFSLKAETELSSCSGGE